MEMKLPIPAPPRKKKKNLESFKRFLIFRNTSKLFFFLKKLKNTEVSINKLWPLVYQILHGNEVQFKTKHLINKQKI